ncbi:MAG: hypothetical protein ABIP95_11445 [Pelobium sp.]
MRILIISILIIANAASCGKQKVIGDKLIGEWVLKSEYMDPGDGSGKYSDVAGGSTKTVTFKQDSTFENKDLSNFDYQHYSINSDSTLTFKSNNNVDIQMRYRISGDLLTINPPCREGCGYRFQKLK